VSLKLLLLLLLLLLRSQKTLVDYHKVKKDVKEGANKAPDLC
jgi:hypothetical protein